MAFEKKRKSVLLKFGGFEEAGLSQMQDIVKVEASFHNIHYFKS
jgi:hypothetical protein